VLRAGPFSDERVIRLVNRRFVPLYFDLNDAAPAADSAANRFVTEAEPDLLGSSVDTPPLLVMTPDGDVLGKISNYASEREVLEGLLDVLEKQPRWNAATKEELAVARGGDPLARADLLIDLGRTAKARELLAKTPGAAAALRLAHLENLLRRDEAVAPALARVDDAELADDVRVERAWLKLRGGDPAEAKKLAEQVARSSPRSSEARYLAGVAEFRAGRRAPALATWKSMITGCSQDRWVYRADWAYTQTLDGDRRSFSTSDAKSSLLGRIGYMGRRNPDLDPPANLDGSGGR
jgi:tetratricopeptide (TPR) repeat protein